MLFRDHNLGTRLLIATELFDIFSAFQWVKIGNVVFFLS